MTTDTWNARDLPVLRAVIDLYETNGGIPITPPEIEAKLGFDADTVQRSLRALDSPPSLFDRLEKDWDGQIIMLGRPTARALQVAGAWPSPENLLEQLIGALNAAAGDDDRAPEERSKLRQAASYLGSFASQVAIGALGGAGGNLLGG
ncbi:hypothetical protein [Mycobacteroides abscessus]|uniref:hypothetical protein n=1 Tax=Mycobacteroides abscessus TaxID=36809 RepID=UPI000C255DAE|nr:hypothetical protein [Mycobacteroides abscessus]